MAFPSKHHTPSPGSALPHFPLPMGEGSGAQADDQPMEDHCMSEASEAGPQSAAERIAQDRRMKHTPILVQAMRRPELGAIAGLLAVIIFFLLRADGSMFTLAGAMTVLAPASELGILAIAAALLMIGGEFDLSIGSMMAFAGLVLGICLAVLGWRFELALAASFAVAAMLGALNGQIVIRTKLPSFIVTLAFLFILRGLSLVGLKAATGGSTQLRGIAEAAGDATLAGLFQGVAFAGAFKWLAEMGLIARFPSGMPTVAGVPVSILWFIGF